MVLTGMMVETMAGKSSACHGLPFDATPFTFSEKDSAVDYFGKTLVKGNCSVCEGPLERSGAHIPVL